MEQAKLRGYLSSSEAENHFGLKSVYNRLFLYYNNKCKFRIFSQKIPVQLLSSVYQRIGRNYDTCINS